MAARARDPDELDAEDEEELNKGPPSLLWRVFAAFCYMVGGGVLWEVACCGWCIAGDTVVGGGVLWVVHCGCGWCFADGTVWVVGGALWVICNW